MLQPKKLLTRLRNNTKQQRKAKTRRSRRRQKQQGTKLKQTSTKPRLQGRRHMEEVRVRALLYADKLQKHLQSHSPHPKMQPQREVLLQRRKQKQQGTLRRHSRQRMRRCKLVIPKQSRQQLRTGKTRRKHTMMSGRHHQVTQPPPVCPGLLVLFSCLYPAELVQQHLSCGVIGCSCLYFCSFP